MDVDGLRRRAHEAAVSVARPLALRYRERADHRLAPVADAIEAIRRRGDIPSAPDRPVLLLSAGWRSGSTLLQRLVIGSGATMVWGEPWSRTDVVARLAESLRPLAAGWPRHKVFPDELVDDVAELRGTWVANLFPPLADLIESHRALLRRLFAQPAAELGFDRWGIKEVRLGIGEIAYLRLLFPEAPIVFLYRNPADCWVSYRAGRFAAHARFPDRPVFGAPSFGRFWAEQVSGVRSAADRYDVLCVRYEDLRTATPRLRQRLEEHFDAPLDWSVLGTAIDGTGGRPVRIRPRLYPHERAAIRLTAGAAALAAGYDL